MGGEERTGEGTEGYRRREERRGEREEMEEKIREKGENEIGKGGNRRDGRGKGRQHWKLPRVVASIY